MVGTASSLNVSLKYFQKIVFHLNFVSSLSTYIYDEMVNNHRNVDHVN